jgi:hypothetical protein
MQKRIQNWQENVILQMTRFESNIVTTGGSGFGLMSIIVGVEEVFFAKSRSGIQTFCRIDFLEKQTDFMGHGLMDQW